MEPEELAESRALLAALDAALKGLIDADR